ncbi:AAA family ATPase, partial [Myxococcota bacterium]|nr:AAA family ATPase [Myxococcota bacterium]
MRIARLELTAFGPFSDRALELGGASGPGLCVIYGPNEAGKSSALRAIRSLLYGIPHQSEDNFVHRHQDLRIGARLCFAQGVTSDVVRRKGTKQTLVAEGEAGARAVRSLAELTQAVPEAVFAHFYGLDHPGLVEGSRSLLEDRGELGRALFGAGLGIVHLRQLIEHLESEASALFKPQGKNQRIPAAVAEWKALQSTIRDRALDPGRFEEQARAVATLASRLASIERALEATRAELSRCHRLKDARQALVRVEDELREARARVARESAREGAIVRSPRVLAALEPIESIHQALGAYRETCKQLPKREEAAALLEAEVASLASALGAGWDSEPLLRRTVERARRVRELAAEAVRFEDRLAKAGEDEREAGAEVRRRVLESEAEHASAEKLDRDPEPLARALARARKLGPIDAQIDEHRRQAQAIAAECARAESQLGLGSWTGERLEALALPSASLIELHARRFAEHAGESARLDERRRALAEERLSTGEDLGRLRAEGSLPSEEDLEAERHARDRLWRSLRDRLVAPADPAAGESFEALSLLYEERVRAADQLADRLRGEADRVARGAALEARAARLDAARAQL